MKRVACLHCDLLITLPALHQREHAVCPRCKQTVTLDNSNVLTDLAWLITALLIFFPAIWFPFLSMETAGRTQSVSLLTSIVTVANDDMLPLAVVVFVLVIFFPLLRILGLLSVVIPLSHQQPPFFGMAITRWLINVAPWNMVEVYLVGVLVALVKLTGIASIYFSTGFYAFMLFIVINAIISIRLPSKRIWQTISATLYQ